jgi:hypothetical protein
MKLCFCGSGKERYQLVDAAGIFCAYVCEACEAKKRRTYNPIIFESGTVYSATGEEEDIYIDDDRREA